MAARKDNVIEYHATESAKEFHEAAEETKVLWGPMGSGKTSAALIEFFFQAKESPVPLRGIVLRSSWPELRDSTLATWNEWFGDIATWRAADKIAILPLPKKGSGETQEHQLFFRYCSRPEEASKFLSTEFGFAFLEECVPAYQQSGVMGSGLSKEIFDIVQLRMRQKGVHRRTIVATFNPPFPSHWCNKEFIESTTPERMRKSYFIKRQPPRENEANLPPGYYDKIIDRMDPDLVKRFVYGEIIQSYGGVEVFPECRDGIHILDAEIEPIPGIPLVLGFDFGRWAATLITQITPLRQWRILMELQSENTGFVRHLELLQTMLKQHFSKFEVRNSWGDPSGANRGFQTDEITCMSLAAESGFPIAPGKQDLQSRIEAMKQRFMMRLDNQEPAIIISRPHCPLLVEGLLGGYRYAKARDGTVGHEPIKNHFSHVQDAAQYIATMEFELSPTARFGVRDDWGRPVPTWDPLKRYPVKRHSHWMGR